MGTAQNFRPEFPQNQNFPGLFLPFSPVNPFPGPANAGFSPNAPRGQ